MSNLGEKTTCIPRLVEPGNSGVPRQSECLKRLKGVKPENSGVPRQADRVVRNPSLDTDVNETMSDANVTCIDDHASVKTNPSCHNDLEEAMWSTGNISNSTSCVVPALTEFTGASNTLSRRSNSNGGTPSPTVVTGVMSNSTPYPEVTGATSNITSH